MADHKDGNCVVARNHIRNVLFDILRQLQTGNGSSDTLDHVQYLIDCLYEIILRCFDIAKRTVERQLREFHLSIRATYSDMSNEELDAEITSISRNFPITGYKCITGFLLSRNLRIQQQRICEAMRRVNLEGTLLRALELNIVQRRKYQVRSPLALWHIDGSHKLVRYVAC